MPINTIDSELTSSAANPFIAATKQTFSTMLQCTPTRESLALKSDQSGRPPYEVSAMINVAGSANGLITLSMPARTSFNILERMLHVSVESITEDVIDAVGEIANIIVGAAKVHMDQMNLTINIPNVVIGRNRVIRYPGNVTPLSADFSSEVGAFTLEFGFQRSD